MPEQEPKFHEHPRNMHDKAYGVKLVAGDVLEETDLYDSSGGFWTPAPCPGLTLGEGVAAVWIRPMPEPEGTIRIEARPPSRRPAAATDIALEDIEDAEHEEGA